MRRYSRCRRFTYFRVAILHRAWPSLCRSSTRRQRHSPSLENGGSHTHTQRRRTAQYTSDADKHDTLFFPCGRPFARSRTLSPAHTHTHTLSTHTKHTHTHTHTKHHSLPSGPLSSDATPTGTQQSEREKERSQRLNECALLSTVLSLRSTVALAERAVSCC